MAHLAKDDRGVTCADCAAPWADRSRVVYGTVTGSVIVYDLPPHAYYLPGAGWELLARTAPRDAPHRTAGQKTCAVMDVRLSKSGRRVLAVYEHGAVCLFRLELLHGGGSGGGSVGGAGKRKLGEPTQKLVPIRIIAPDELTLTGSALLRSRQGVHAVRAAFAPSMSLMGEQGHAVVTMSDGTLFRVDVEGGTRSTCWPPPFATKHTPGTAAAVGQQSTRVAGYRAEVLSPLGHQHDAESDVLHLPMHTCECAGAGVVIVSSSGRLCAWDTVEGVAASTHACLDALGAVEPSWTHDVDLNLRTWHALIDSTVHVTLADDGRNAVRRYVFSTSLIVCKC
jgi:hypothetical protein